MTPDAYTVPIGTVFHSVTVEFIDKAAAESGKTRSDFIRDAVLASAKRVLGKDAPEVPPILRGRQDEITLAAQKAGLTREQYLRKTALAALGVEFKPRAKKPRKK
jgi:hypothetical protein